MIDYDFLIAKICQMNWYGKYTCLELGNWNFKHEDLGKTAPGNAYAA